MNHTMQHRTVPLLAVLALVLSFLTACGASDDPDSGIPTAGSSGGTSSDGGEPATAESLTYAECMRDQGIDVMDPDPVTGVSAFAPGVDPESPAVQAALEACQELVAGGLRGSAGEASQDLSVYLAFAECMRENGLPDFPDPQPGEDGMFAGAKIDRDSPAFKAASEACAGILSGEEGV